MLTQRANQFDLFLKRHPTPLSTIIIANIYCVYTMGNTLEVPETSFFENSVHKYLIFLMIEYEYSKVTTYDIK